MQYPLTFGDGTVSAPGIAWTNETGTGFYRAAAGDMRVTIQGFGDTFRLYNGLVYARNAADDAWAAVVYSGGAGSVPVGTTLNDTLVWNSTTWVRQPANPGGVLPVGSVSLPFLQWNVGTSTWTAVGSSPAPTTVNQGTVANTTLIWSTGSSAWVENLNHTVTAAGAAVFASTLSATVITEGGTSLVAKYLGIAANAFSSTYSTLATTATNSLSLGGVLAASYPQSATVDNFVISASAPAPGTPAGTITFVTV
jgi:hypothetical protein